MACSVLTGGYLNFLKNFEILWPEISEKTLNLRKSLQNGNSILLLGIFAKCRFILCFSCSQVTWNVRFAVVGQLVSLQVHYSRYRQRYRIVVVFPLALFVALVLQTFLALFVVLLAFILCAIIFSDCSSMLSRVVKSGSYSLCMKTVHCPPLNLAMMYTITIVQPVCNNDKPKVAQTHVHNNLPTRH